MPQDIHRNTAVLIGLGKIALSYEAGLRNSRSIDCRYVCDNNPDAVSRSVYKDKEYVSDYLSLFRTGKVDMAIIATPPDTHSSIIRDCLDYGVYPIVEKPVAQSQAVLESLLQSEGCFEVIFHWLCGSEVIWFADNIILNDVRSIRISIKDPYADRNGHIRPEFLNKAGCWLDSGVNALSLLTRLVDLDAFAPDLLALDIDEAADQPYRAVCRMHSGEKKIEIDVQWDVEENHKITVIEADGHNYVIDHTGQSVKRDGVLLFCDDGMSRLSRHYYNFFVNYPLSATNWNTNLLIHRKLYEVYQCQNQGNVA